VYFAAVYKIGVIFQSVHQFPACHKRHIDINKEYRGVRWSNYVSLLQKVKCIFKGMEFDFIARKAPNHMAKDSTKNRIIVNKDDFSFVVAVHCTLFKS